MINWKDGSNGGKADEIELYCFYVEPFFKGLGIGRMLIRYLCDEAAALGKKKIYAWVLKENASARRFYERNGFAADGREELAEGTTEYLVYYEKRLSEKEEV